MRIPKTYGSEADARQAATLLAEGVYPALITEAVEKRNKYKKEMIELTVLVLGRSLRAWLMANDKGAALLRSCCYAVGAGSAYEAQEISASLFPGKDCEVKITIEPGRGSFPAQNRIEEFRAPAAASVVSLRSA